MAAPLTRASAVPLTLLALGAVVGSIAGLVVSASDPAALTIEPGGDIVAVVDGVGIERVEVERALSALASDRRNRLEPRHAVEVVERMIDEELLVQGALADDLPHTDRAVREALSAAVLASVEAQILGEAVAEDELRSFYERVLGDDSSGEASTLTGDRHGAEPAGAREDIERVRAAVELAYVRERSGLAVREYLDWLRDGARVSSR